MPLNIFKRQKIENEKSLDLENTMVELPKSKKEISIAKCLNEYDTILNMHGYASDDHMVKVGENEMSVKDLVAAHIKACNDMEEMKKPKENDGDESDMDDPAVENSEMDDMGEDDSVDNAEDESAEEKKKEKMSNELEQKRLAKEKALRLKNANLNANALLEDTPTVLLPEDKVARGKARYGAK